MSQLASASPLTHRLYRPVYATQLRYDAWWFVLLAVLLALAAVIFLGLTIWCTVYGHGGFVGEFRWVRWGVSVSGHCRY